MTCGLVEMAREVPRGAELEVAILALVLGLGTRVLHDHPARLSWWAGWKGGGVSGEGLMEDCRDGRKVVIRRLGWVMEVVVFGHLISNGNNK